MTHSLTQVFAQCWDLPSLKMKWQIKTKYKQYARQQYARNSVSLLHFVRSCEGTVKVSDNSYQQSTEKKDEKKPKC